jgi:hypothetical protein
MGARRETPLSPEPAQAGFVAAQPPPGAVLTASQFASTAMYDGIHRQQSERNAEKRAIYFWSCLIAKAGAMVHNGRE